MADFRSARRVGDGEGDALTRPISKRKGSGRSRTGCRTCRIRRVKCDETHPDCVKCSSTGRSCEWFAQDITGKTRSRLLSSSQPTFAREEQSCFPGLGKRQILRLPDSPFISPEHSRSFFYFRQRTVYQLAGWFSPDFWDYVLLQATHHNEIIRSLVVAIAAQHECFEFCMSPTGKENSRELNEHFALQQYNKAIRKLVQETHDVDIYLISCLLFASFETLRSCPSTAKKHIESGTRIFSSITGETENDTPLPSNPLIPLPLLAQLFTRLDTQVHQVRTHYVWSPCIARRWVDQEACFSPEIPEVFTSVDDARRSLDYSWSDIMHIINAAQIQNYVALPQVNARPTLSEDEIHSLEQRCRKWRTAFAAFKENEGECLYGKDRKAAMMLEIYSLLSVTVIFTEITVSQTSYDRYTDFFAEIVDLAEVLLREDSTASTAPAFQMDSGVVVALAEVIWKCRETRIRRKGIELLEKYPRVEGLWDGVLVAKIGREVVSVEQDGYEGDVRCEDVPEYLRVSLVDVEFNGEETERSGWIVLERGKSACDSGKLKLRRWISW